MILITRDGSKMWVRKNKNCRRGFSLCLAGQVMDDITRDESKIVGSTNRDFQSMVGGHL